MSLFKGEICFPLPFSMPVFCALGTRVMLASARVRKPSFLSTFARVYKTKIMCS